MKHDRMQSQRFEMKYLIDESIAINIRHFVQSRLELDEAGVNSPNYSYRVNSIYLDSEQLHTFWEWVNANRNRYKLRLRYYDSRPETPVYLEIKRRQNECILKQRCAIRKSAAPIVLAGQFPAPDDIVTRDAKGMDALEQFIRLIVRLNAKPQALVSYWREAYIDPENNAVRVTMDREVQISPRMVCDFGPPTEPPTHPFVDKIILELKFNNRFPNWFNEMVQLFNLSRTPAAKYCEGVAALWQPALGNCPPNNSTP